MNCYKCHSNIVIAGGDSFSLQYVLCGSGEMTGWKVTCPSCLPGTIDVTPFLGSSVVERVAVNDDVGGSIPPRGANHCDWGIFYL